MADSSTKIGPIFRGANGGLSDDLFTGIQNSFYYSDGIEPLESSNGITLKERLYKLIDLGLTGKDNGGEVVAIIPDGTDLFIVRKFKISYYDSNTGTIIDVYSEVSGGFVDADLFGGRFFVADYKYLVSVPFSKIRNGELWSTLETSDKDTFELSYEGDHFIYSSDAILAITDGNKVKKIELATINTLKEGLTLQDGYRARIICELGGYLRIVCDDGNYGSEILLWDKSKKAATEIIPLEGYKFSNACIYGGYMYLISNKGLGLLNGYQYYVIKELGNYSGSAINNSMTVFDDKLYFVSSKDWGGLGIYGAKNKNYNDVLHYGYNTETINESRSTESHTDFDTSVQLKRIAQSSGYLYISGNKKDADDNQQHYYIFRMGGTGGYTTNEGELHTMAYYGGSMSSIKDAQYLRLGYSLRYGTLKVYYKTDKDTLNYSSVEECGWHELGTITRTSGRSPFSTTLKLNCRFQWIQFRFVLEGSGERIDEEFNNPILYSADLYYNEILE